MKTGGKSFDFYRKIPVDLTESTALGAFFSVIALIFMSILFVVELTAFLSTSYETSVILDNSLDGKLRINFNITMMDIPCDFVAVDVLDVLGTNRMNVTRNIEKWHLDANGVRRMFQGRNKEQHDIVYEDEDDHPYNLEELHRNGEHAIPLSTENFKQALEASRYTFVDFYAPWCIWCQRLAPTWELLAEDLEMKKDIPVTIVKVDCVEEKELCNTQQIRSFPTLRFFEKSQPHMPDYKGDRTREAFLEYISQMMKRIDAQQHIPEEHRKTHIDSQNKRSDHRGCMLNGYLMVNRVPGNFHIEARSKYHDLEPTMTNLSHVVHKLSFGDPLKPVELNLIANVPKDMTQISPLDERVYANDANHQAFHHFIKVVSTNYDIGSQTVKGYQQLAMSQIMQYGEDQVPEARFSYQITPMGVVVKKTGRKWYDFVTSVCAIIGGSFTLIGVIDAAFYKILKNKQF